jgi:hypothetical protein
MFKLRYVHILDILRDFALDVASHRMRKMFQELLLVTSARYCQTKCNRYFFWSISEYISRVGYFLIAPGFCNVCSWTIVGTVFPFISHFRFTCIVPSLQAIL